LGFIVVVVGGVVLGVVEVGIWDWQWCSKQEKEKRKRRRDRVAFIDISGLIRDCNSPISTQKFVTIRRQKRAEARDTQGVCNDVILYSVFPNYPNI
jgi:hypothetical protein